ncbi:MAG: NUDIX domain-containing protein [Gammaproteobacteria bacterium]
MNEESQINRAAGILFVTPDSRILLMRRVDEGHYWSVPGGNIEPDETPEQAALREVMEETGVDPGILMPLNRRIKDGIDFTTFRADIPTEFVPVMNAEHDLYRWSTADDALEQGGLHPGVTIALVRDGLDEIDLARAMALDEIASPVRYQGLMLVNMRITGTGQAWRAGLKEHVWRDPALYLNDDFLARCNGLPVILEHPPGQRLNGKEYRDRAVGAIIYAYIRGEEVWSIGRIQDEEAALMLEQGKLSTSPAVVFKAGEEGKRIPLENGTHILIEEKPVLVDHIAFCLLGVWDVDGPPTGVQSTSADEIAAARNDSADKSIKMIIRNIRLYELDKRLR